MTPLGIPGEPTESREGKIIILGKVCLLTGDFRLRTIPVKTILFVGPKK